MDTIILYRDDVDWRSEKDAAEKYFNCTKTRMEIKQNHLVIGRYSVVPFYKEQEYDINYVGAKLINSYSQHCYIANMIDWVEDLKEYTPKTWSILAAIPDEGPFVLKGATNSKKNYWNTHMFAKDKKEAIKVHSRLCEDNIISYQDIFIRQYIPLKTYMTGIQGLPITKEFRFFVCYGEVISGGYYWSNYIDELDKVPSVDEVPREFLNKVINIVRDKVNFFVVDVAQTESGDWVVIELNDGQQSGLSENDPEVLYKNLNGSIRRNKK